MEKLSTIFDSPEITDASKKISEKLKDLQVDEDKLNKISEDIAENVASTSLESYSKLFINSISLIVGLLTLIFASIIVLNHAVLMEDPNILRITIPMGILVTLIIVFFIRTKLSSTLNK